jgi:hypothetical protein
MIIGRVDLVLRSIAGLKRYPSQFDAFFGGHVYDDFRPDDRLQPLQEQSELQLVPSGRQSTAPAPTAPSSTDTSAVTSFLRRPITNASRQLFDLLS